MLVIGAETLSRVADPDDRGTCILFGDGAGAVVLSARPTTSPACSRWDLGCDGSAAGLLEHPRRRQPPARPRAETVAAGEHYLKMEGQEVFRRAVRVVVESADDRARPRPASTAADVDLFVPHQANLRIIEAAANRLGHPAGAHASSTSTATATRRPRRSRSPWPRRPTTAASHDGDLVLLSGFGAGHDVGQRASLRWGPAR